MLKVVPSSLRAANAFVKQHHRHHPAARGCKFCFGVETEVGLVGVAIVGRPVARMLDDGLTLEVNRTCTVGTKNANSKLYGCAARVARELGYRLIITYTLPSESGDSLRAAGWVCKGPAGGGSWSRKKRVRYDEAPTETKIRWEKILNQSVSEKESETHGVKKPHLIPTTGQKQIQPGGNARSLLSSFKTSLAVLCGVQK